MTKTQGAQQPQMLEDVPSIPEWMEELFQRRVAVNRYYAKMTPADAKPGQAWTLKLPKDLIDPIMEESIMPVVLLQNYTDAREMESDEGAWYAFLCLGQEPVADRPIEKGKKVPWISAKELTGRDELLSAPPIDQLAAWVLPLCPTYVKPEWLAKCVADMQADAATKAYHHGIDCWFYCEQNYPDISETHRKNRIGGLSPYELISFIRDCWEV